MMKTIPSAFIFIFLSIPGFSQKTENPVQVIPMEKIPVEVADGPFEPTWESLGDKFKTPGWFREAKIGIWLHWGPQSIGEDGDWYAKWIYMPQSAWGEYTRVYPHHLQRIGHPSIHGYKDMLPLWKAENWDPKKLMALYKRAGARYVIAQGMHHDNFDLWNSTYQPWNSMKIGPKKDILRGWKSAADKEGMKFGIAFHGDYSLFWFQPAFLSDIEGPLRGVPYDGAKNYVGESTWWKDMGLDLKDLYGIDLKDDVVYPEGFDGDSVAYRMKDPLSHGIPDGNLKKNIDFARWYATKWTNRVVDAIDQFSPDFIYFDGGASYPFCGWFTGRGYRADATPRVISHLYNSNIKKNGGELKAMAFTKGNEDPRAIAVNVESSFPEGIKKDQPWQTEVGLGEWFYLKGTYYESSMVIHQMLEAISRDGNYVINIPLNPSGQLDPGGEQTLKDMGDWMEINGEGIYNSSAWKLWGEGSIIMEHGNLGPKQAATPYTSQDIRFTVNDGSLYAWLMAWPSDNKILIRSLQGNKKSISSITLLGSDAKVRWKQTPSGLEVFLPSIRPCKFAYGLKINGREILSY
jgi:alpha-L-fucosidase